MRTQEREAVAAGEQVAVEASIPGLSSVFLGAGKPTSPAPPVHIVADVSGSGQRFRTVA
jgi:hypothetical protein